LVEVSGKPRTYYSLDTKAPIDVAVAGPVRLTTLTRLRFTEDMPDTVAYGILIRSGDEVLRRHWTKTVRSTASFPEIPGEALGASRKLSVEVGEGYHILHVSLLGEGTARAVMRFYVPAEYKAQRYVSLAPIDPPATLTALASEKQILYYPIDSSSSVTVQVVGPTTLRVLSRMHFDYRLHGSRRYSLVIGKDGDSLREDTFETTRSTSVTFVGRDDLIPGKNKLTLIDVPRGVHRYSFEMGAASEAPASVRFTIPSADVFNRSRDRR